MFNTVTISDGGNCPSKQGRTVNRNGSKAFEFGIFEFCTTSH